MFKLQHLKSFLIFLFHLLTTTFIYYHINKGLGILCFNSILKNKDEFPLKKIKIINHHFFLFFTFSTRLMNINEKINAASKCAKATQDDALEVFTSDPSADEPMSVRLTAERPGHSEALLSSTW